MPDSQTTPLEVLTEQRDNCKKALDQAQEALNERLIENSPVRVGDIVSVNGTIFRIVKIWVKTMLEDDHMVDKLQFVFQKKRETSWEKVHFNTNELAEMVLSGKAPVVRHYRESD